MMEQQSEIEANQAKVIALTMIVPSLVLEVTLTLCVRGSLLLLPVVAVDLVTGTAKVKK